MRNLTRATNLLRRTASHHRPAGHLLLHPRDTSQCFARPFCATPRHDNPKKQQPAPKLDPLSAPPAEDAPTPPASNWNIANYVTSFRLTLAPAAGYLILSGQNTLALSVVIVAGASDALDGYLARRYHLQTPLGEIIDPLADKLLVACTAGALCVQGSLPVWIVVLVLARDAALVTGAAMVPASKRLAPTNVSKANTALQIALCAGATASGGDMAIVDPIVVHGLAVATAATTSASGLSYAVRFWRNFP